MMLAADDSKIQFCCPNGHRIRAAARLEGRKTSCPKCQIPVIVGAPDLITDTGALAILNDVEADALHQIQKQRNNVVQATAEAAQASHETDTEQMRPEANCPRCDATIDRHCGICPECRIRLDGGGGAFQRLYRVAMRSLR